MENKEMVKKKIKENKSWIFKSKKRRHKLPILDIEKRTKIKTKRVKRHFLNKQKNF